MSVFISHDLADQQVVRQIAQALRKNGLSVWDNSEILPGDNWAAMTAQALEEAEVMVVILTTNSMESEYVRRETSYAFGERRFENRVVPVLVGPLTEDKLPWALRRLDVVRLDFDAEGRFGPEATESLRSRLNELLPEFSYAQIESVVDENGKPFFEPVKRLAQMSSKRSIKNTDSDRETEGEFSFPR